MDPSNSELLDRIEQLELKVDRITYLLEQASGAWFFVKLMSAIALGAAVLWHNLVKDWWQR